MNSNETISVGALNRTTIEAIKKDLFDKLFDEIDKVVGAGLGREERVSVLKEIIQAVMGDDESWRTWRLSNEPLNPETKPDPELKRMIQSLFD